MVLSDVDEDVGQIVQDSLSNAKRFELFNKRNGEPGTVYCKGRNIIRFVFLKNLPGGYMDNRLKNAWRGVGKLVEGFVIVKARDSTVWEQ